MQLKLYNFELSRLYVKKWKCDQMNEELIDAFEYCWRKIKEGVTIEECLQEFPNLAGDLQPILETAIAARSMSVSKVPSEVINRSRTRLLGHAAQLRVEKPARESFMRFPLVVISALLLALVLILGSRELIVVSAESLPGDSLYPIKRVVQDIRVRLAPNRELKHEIETQYRAQRIEEIVDLLAVGRIEMVSFDGVVDHITPTRWTVSGINVVLSENTKVIGDISLGSLIEVEGLTSPGGWIEAHELHLREYEFIGQVETIDIEFWIISNVKFEMISNSQIYSGAQVGDEVLVLARTRDDGTQYALAIIRLPSYIENLGSAYGDVASLIEGKNAGEELEFSGKVEYISSSYWVIDGYTVMISLLTEIKEDINLGDLVIVHAFIGEDGSLTAREVDLGSDDIGHDQNDDFGDHMFEDEQGSDDDPDQNKQDDDLDQGDDPGDSNNNSGIDEGDSDDSEGEKDGSEDDGIGGHEDDSSSEDSEGGSDEESGSSDDDEPDDNAKSDDTSESNGDGVEDNEGPAEPEETKEPDD